MALESIVHLDFEPIAALGLVRLDVDVVDHRTEICEGVKVREKLSDIVANLAFVSVLDLKFLLIKLAEAIHALANVIIVQESSGGVILSELQQENSVPFVLLCRFACLLLLIISQRKGVLPIRVLLLSCLRTYLIYWRN